MGQWYNGGMEKIVRIINNIKAVFKIFVYAFNNFASAKFISSNSKSRLFLFMFI